MLQTTLGTSIAEVLSEYRIYAAKYLRQEHEGIGMERVREAMTSRPEEGRAQRNLSRQSEGYERKEAGGLGRSGDTVPAFTDKDTALGIPGRSRERWPDTLDGFWNDWKFGIGYDPTEWTSGLFWRAVWSEGCCTTAWVFFTLVTWISLMQNTLTDLGILRVALAAGLSYGSLNWMFHSVSGGHMNPAVSLALMWNGSITITRAIMYLGAQLVGGIVGALAAKGMSFPSFNGIRGGTNRVVGGIGWGSALLGEIFGSLFICTAFLVAYDRRRRHDADHVNVLAPLMLGLVVVAAHLVLIPFTWCAINPARAFGPAVVTNIWTYHWIWWVGPIAGATAAPLLYESFFKHFHSGTTNTGGTTAKQRASATQGSQGYSQSSASQGYRGTSRNVDV